MSTLTGRPQLLKQANLALVRKVIKAKGTATRAEIANETKISSTTVRSLLTEMMQNGEIESIGYDESSGGRKAERYRFNPERYYGAAFCIIGNQIHSLLINICGEILDIQEQEVTEKNVELAITRYLDNLVSQKEIKAIGIGVPGIVENGSFWKKDVCDDALYKIDVGTPLTEKYGIPVVLENDLKATVIGVERCYQKEYPCEKPENTNMAYLHFEKGCVSAGFIAEGKVIRGSSNFAGELGLIPISNGKLLDDHMNRCIDNKAYVDLVVQILSWICGILNPKYVVLGGPGFRRECIGPIGDQLFSLLPKNMFAEIYYSSDLWHDYHQGMAYLTAEKMFDEVQFVKE